MAGFTGQPMPERRQADAQHPAVLPDHLQQLHRSAISDEIIAERGYRSVASPHEYRKLYGPNTHSNALLKRVILPQTLVIPIYRLGQHPPYAHVLRPDRPRTQPGPRPKPIKYEWPKGTPPVLDVLPRYRQALRDHTRPLWVTEGAKKADALASLYGDRIVPVAMNGTYGWRGRDERGNVLVLPDWEEIALNNRTIVLVPDGDVRSNKQVAEATRRLARLLAARANVDIAMVLLPAAGSDGTKVGIDDFIAMGHGTDDIEAHLLPVEAALQKARVPATIDPATGAKIWLPPGYDVRGKMLYRVGTQGESLLYNGIMHVTGTGTDVSTGAETATVAWGGKGRSGSATLPRADIARARTLLDALASRGAGIHEGNAKALTTYLSEYITENADAIPHTLQADRYGVIGDGLLLPTGSMGFGEQVSFTGAHPISVGHDQDGYPRLLREIRTWDGMDVLWLVLGLALAGPLVARLRPRRNPTLYMAGTSGYGKSTVAMFAVGAFGDPTVAPLLLSFHSTVVGVAQTISSLGGIPLKAFT